jgi:putative ABC transport system permease protein
VDAFLLAVGSTLLASAYPAWRASRMVIVDALRFYR